VQGAPHFLRSDVLERRCWPGALVRHEPPPHDPPRALPYLAIVLYIAIAMCMHYSQPSNSGLGWPGTMLSQKRLPRGETHSTAKRRPLCTQPPVSTGAPTATEAHSHSVHTDRVPRHRPYASQCLWACTRTASAVQHHTQWPPQEAAPAKLPRHQSLPSTARPYSHLSAARAPDLPLLVLPTLA
jgi:hypothetical protein